tara:strand:- start:762 stop:1748 length:987 start_codon:yes stop_codon:yes gene_type:complete
MRTFVSIGLFIDKLFYNIARNPKIIKPIIIVGNPRSGTTFLQRYLIGSGLGIGAELWQLIYPSIILQKIIRPLLPALEKFSPARHHAIAAHETSLTSVETDDVGLFFRYFDGFFLYGFLLSFSDDDLFEYFDPKVRDTSKRDFDWLESVWSRIIVNKNMPYIGKLFSLSTSLPSFQARFPDAKILYMVRDPLNVIPSGLSLVTGVLHKRFGFWNINKEKRDQYIERLYIALVTLLQRFHEDWSNDNIKKSSVFIVRYDHMMNDFDQLMNRIFKFIDQKPSKELINKIKKTAEDQRNYKSKHKYDLNKFGLTEKQIREDCHFIYETFLT